MNKQIMVIDDLIDSLTLTGLILEMNGYRVVTVKNASVSLDLFQTLTPDLYILSAKLSGVSARGLCRQIRSHPHSADKPIIIVMTEHYAPHRDLFLKAGANSCLIKPTSRDTLLKEVQTVLG